MLAELFITFIYQPFLNVLVFLYWILSFFMENPDMGVAVILLTIFIRLLLLPLSLAGHESEEERRAIAAEIKEIEDTFSSDPIRAEKEKKKVMRKNKRILIAELFNLSIQVSIALMLWKMFQTGLPGKDLHMIYNFMPEVEKPFNLMFLGKYDLTHTNYTLNLLQSILIFVLETVSVLASPFKVTRKEVVRLQLILPVVSFLVFMAMPAGKKLFIITTLIISIILALYRLVKRKYQDYRARWESKEAADSQEEQVVVKTVG